MGDRRLHPAFKLHFGQDWLESGHLIDNRSRLRDLDPSCVCTNKKVCEKVPWAVFISPICDNEQLLFQFVVLTLNSRESNLCNADLKCQALPL